MDCENMHMYLLNEGNLVQSSFCDEQLEEIKSVKTRCCNKPNISVDVFKIVCTNCGSVHGFKSANVFVDFYENRHRIGKKSVYHKQYHIMNVMNDIAQKNNIQIGYYNREKILRIFRLIDQASLEVYSGQKRMISVNFIIKQLFDILGIEYKFIPLTKSKKTLKYYSQWWAQVYDLIKMTLFRICWMGEELFPILFFKFCH